MATPTIQVQILKIKHSKFRVSMMIILDYSEETHRERGKKRAYQLAPL